jgi:hypothetical protein
MTTGNVLYLALSIGSFLLFAAVLAYQSWREARLVRDTQAASQPEPHRAIAA